jgi:hypothetical protein
MNIVSATAGTSSTGHDRAVLAGRHLAHVQIQILWIGFVENV